MRTRVTLMFLVLATLVLGTVPTQAQLLDEIAVSATDSGCSGGWCLLVQGKGTGVISGGLETVYACSATAYSGSVPSPVTAPAATQVTECFMRTAWPNQTDSIGRTLGGTASGVAGQEELENFSSPVEICVAGKVIFENNSELRVPSSGVRCTLA